MNTKYIILLVIIFILIILLKKSENNIENLAPSNTDLDVDGIRIKENMDKYLEFQKIQERILKEHDFQIGYKELDSVDKKTIGYCPLGQYFKGDVPEELSAENLNQCNQCRKCPKGFYVKEGCMGNVDTVCAAEKVPFGIYMEAHTRPFDIHNMVNPHQHKYDTKKKEDGDEIEFKLSPIEHRHL
tara:strand:+ start:173 stop:727 length:555 start_codon:yes stop_codon:yes gene_type:complete